ncbi:MAG TPA: hypothetical protein VKX25_18580 [Bryobacteraceae bacterium]|jgi:hypothetical protein|nr:hypothetical protein [Bryobacteraceae bacterium]
MKADRVEVSWDNQKNKWLVRIIVGEEVIRRYCNDSKNVDTEALRASALKTAREEGYEVDPAAVTVAAASTI